MECGPRLYNTNTLVELMLLINTVLHGRVCTCSERILKRNYNFYVVNCTFSVNWGSFFFVVYVACVD
jgi:hypothetical protein